MPEKARFGLLGLSALQTCLLIQLGAPYALLLDCR